MNEELSPEEVKKIIAELAAAGKKKPSKYKNKKVTVDGFQFDSKREAACYEKLRAMEKAGLIKNLKLQQPWPIKINGLLVCKYVADFQYESPAGGPVVLADAKGFRTRVYKLKKRLVKAVWDLDIVEL